jgi:hypothetical protein
MGYGGRQENASGYDSSRLKREVIAMFRLGISIEGIDRYRHCWLNKPLLSLFSKSKSRCYLCKLIKWSGGTDVSGSTVASFFADSIFQCCKVEICPYIMSNPSVQYANRRVLLAEIMVVITNPANVSKAPQISTFLAWCFQALQCLLYVQRAAVTIKLANQRRHV